jgi:hypothetical protein
MQENKSTRKVAELHGGERPSLDNIRAVTYRLQEIDAKNDVDTDGISFALHMEVINSVRPVRAEGEQNTKENRERLAAAQAEYDADFLKKTRDLSKFRAILLNSLTQKETYLGAELMAALRAQGETDMLTYTRVKDPRLLVTMLERYWKVRTTTLNPDLAMRDTWRRWHAIDPAVNAADMYQQLFQAAPREYPEKGIRMAFMGLLSSDKLAAYNALRNQQTALNQDIVNMPLVELAHKIAEKVNDMRAQAAAVHPPPAEGSAERALAAVPLVCTFCSKPNHMEAHCRARLAAIKTLDQAKAESKGARRLPSAGAGAPSPVRTCHKCGQAGHLKANCPVKKKKVAAAAIEAAAAEDDDAVNDNQDSDGKQTVVFSCMHNSL